MTNIRQGLWGVFMCLAVLGPGATVWADCYTVLDAQGKIISQTSSPPVDMSYPLHQTVTARYGQGARLVFGIDDENCGPETEPDAFSQSSGIVDGQPILRTPRRERN